MVTANETYSWHPVMRSILDHWVWKEKPFSKGQAWVDMILLAHHNPCKRVINGILVPMDEGQLAWPKYLLADRWGWSRDKVERFLKMLEADEMLSQQTSQLTTIITLLNYKELRKLAFNKQGSGPDNGQGNAQGNGPTTHKAQYKKERIKEVKKEEIKTGSIDADALPSSPDPENLEAAKHTLRAAVACALLNDPEFGEAWDAFLKMRKDIKEPATEEAQKRLLRKLQKYPVETAIAMVDESIMNNWKGVFPLKEGHGRQSTGQESAAERNDRRFREELGKIAAGIGAGGGDEVLPELPETHA